MTDTKQKMLETADLIIAFWDGISKGTRSLIKCAQNAKKDVITIDIRKVNKDCTA